MELVTIAGICSVPETFIKSIKCHASVRQVSPLTEVRQLARLRLSWERKSSLRIIVKIKMPAWRQNIWPVEHGFYNNISVKKSLYYLDVFLYNTSLSLCYLFITNSELKVCVGWGFLLKLKGFKILCVFLQLSAHLWHVQLLKQRSLKLSSSFLTCILNEQASVSPCNSWAGQHLL